MPLDLGQGIVRVTPPSLPTIAAAPPARADIQLLATPGPRGIQGPPGVAGDIAGQIRIQAVAAEDLEALSLVTVNADGSVRYASNDNAGDEHAPLWLTLADATTGSVVEMLVFGYLEDLTWSWTRGPLYLGVDGAITQTRPATPPAEFSTQIGYAVGPIAVFLNLDPPPDDYTHIQSSPSATWIIDHNLGRKVHVSLFDSLGRVVYSDVEHGSVNQATITFPSPVTGSAVLS